MTEGLVSVDDIVPDSIKKCDECEEEVPSVVVEVWCDTCGQWLCKPCDLDLHKKGRRAQHTRKLHKLKKKADEKKNAAATAAAAAKSPKASAKKTGGLPPPKFVSASIAPWNDQEAPEEMKPFGGGGDKPDKFTGRIMPKQSAVAPWAEPDEDDEKPKKASGVDKAAKMMGLASPTAAAAAAAASATSGGTVQQKKKKTTQDTLSETFDKPASSAIAPWNVQEAPADARPFEGPSGGTGGSSGGDAANSSPELRTEVAPWTVQDNDDFKKSQAQIKQAKKKKKKIVLEGFLKKKSPKGVLKVWQSRYFRLYADGLQYFRHKSDKEPAGVIPIFSIKFINQLDTKKKGCRFDIVIGDSTAGRTFSLLANSFKECTTWVDAMTAELGKYQEATSTNDLTSGQVVNAEHVDNKFWKDPSQVKSLRQTNREALADKLAISAGSGDTIDLRDQQLNKERMVMEIIKEEASGPVGSVYRALDKRDDANLAFLMHVCKKEDGNFKTIKKIFRDMRKLDHPYIFKQVHYGESNDAVWAVYTPPFRSCDSIMAYLEKHRRFPESAVRFIGAQLLLALGYLHGLGFIARNLSPENVYLDADGNVCVCDFLLALEPKNMPSECHEAEYDAPESSSADVTASDWWRLGVFLYEIAVGIPPVRSPESGEAKTADITKQLQAWDIDKLRFPPFVAEDFKDLIRRLLCKSAEERLGADKDYEAVKDHKFFDHEDVNWSLLTTAGSRLKPPEWIKKSVVDDPKTFKGEPAPANLTRTEPEKFACSLIVEIFAARGLKKPEPAIYCLVSVDKGPAQPTKVQKKTTTPEWDAKFEFEVRGPDIPPTSSVVVDLVRETPKGSAKEKMPPVVGSVAMSLTQIKDWAPQAMEMWQSVLDANGLPFGELHVSYLWRQTLLETPKPVVYKQNIKENFFDFFGTPTQHKDSKDKDTDSGASSPVVSPPTSPKSKPHVEDEKPDKPEKDVPKDTKSRMAALGAVAMIPVTSPTGEAPRKRLSVFGSRAPVGTRGAQPTEAQKEKSSAAKEQAAAKASAKAASKSPKSGDDEESSEEEDEDDAKPRNAGGVTTTEQEEDKEDEDEVASDDEGGGGGGGGGGAGGGDDDDDDVPGPPPAEDNKSKAEAKKQEQALREKMEKDMREKMREKVEKELREKRAAAAKKQAAEEEEQETRKPAASRGASSASMVGGSKGKDNSRDSYSSPAISPPPTSRPLPAIPGAVSVMGAPMPAKTRAPAPSAASAASSGDDDEPASGGTLTQKLPAGGGISGAMAAAASAKIAARAGKTTATKAAGYCPECDCTPAQFEPNKFVKYNCKVCYHTHIGSPDLDKKIAKGAGSGGAGSAASAGAGAANKCSSCKCTTFVPNPFKKKVCNSCFHQHQED